MERDRERKREGREGEKRGREIETDIVMRQSSGVYPEGSCGAISILLTLRTFRYEAKFRAKLFSQGNFKMVSLFVPAERSSRGNYGIGSVPQFCDPYVCASERPSVRPCVSPSVQNHKKGYFSFIILLTDLDFVFVPFDRTT